MRKEIAGTQITPMKIALRLFSVIFIMILCMGLGGGLMWYLTGYFHSLDPNIQTTFIVASAISLGLLGGWLDWKHPGKFWFESVFELLLYGLLRPIIRGFMALAAILLH